MEIEQNENGNENIHTYKYKKKFLFSFSIINKYFLFPFFLPLFDFILNHFYEIIRIIQYEEDEDYRFLIIILLSFNYISVGLLYFCNVLGLKTETSKINGIQKTNTEISNKLIYNNSYDKLIAQKSGIKIILILFLLPLLISIYLIGEEFNEYIENPIITYFIFYSFFFKNYFKRKNI